MTTEAFYKMKPLMELYKSGNSKTFRPEGLPDMALWLDVVDSPITQDEDHYVSVWEDISGNNRHAVQENYSQQFRLGVKKTPNNIDMMSAADETLMNVDLSFLTDSSFSMYFVTGHEGVTPPPQNYFIGTGNGYPQTRRMLRAGYYTPVYIFTGVGPTDGVFTSIPSTTGALYKYQIWHFNFEKGVTKSALFYQDGAEYSENLKAGDPTMGMLEAANGVIGCGYTSSGTPSYYWKGEIAAMLIYSSSHSDAERAQVLNYLISRFGL
jgi:hypothetical protein